VFVRTLLFAAAVSAVLPLSEGWQYQHTEPRDTPPAATSAWTEGVDEHPERELWFRTALPSSLPDRPQLVFRAYAGRFDVFVDAQRVYAFSEPAARGRLRLHNIALDPQWAGRTIHLRVAVGERPPILGGTPVIASADTAPSARVNALRGPLRSDAVDIVTGFTLLVLGLLSIVTSRLRRSGNAGALQWFGVFTALYGLRELIDSYLPAILGFDLRDAAFFEAGITYVITIPGWMLARTLIGDGWRSTLRWQVWLFGAFAVVALACDAVLQKPESLRTINNFLVILGGVNIVANILLRRIRATPELRIVSLGAAVFLLFAIANNLASLELLPIREVNETPGFVAFVACLGYAAVRAFLRGERERLALEGELATARDIQRSILPSDVPAIAGLQFSTGYAPATSVAGDVYDFVATSERTTGVLVADVAGHGVPAALIASMVKIAVSSTAAIAHDPAQLLAQLNQILKREVRRTLVTATFLYFDMERRLVRVTNAGHAPPLLLRDGQFTDLGENGVLLGRFGDARYVSTETALRDGDRIMACTDGLIEARNAEGEAFGEERLQALLRQGLAGPAILGAVQAWRHRDQDADDLTIVIVDVK
jgi:sigma-B regulation protein RsbU (phosphoserine phosphatase)